MNLFSERYGYKPVRETLQVESIDKPLRNKLWSILQETYWDTAILSRGGHTFLSKSSPLRTLCRDLWVNLFKRAIDTLSDDWAVIREEFRRHFFRGEWYEVYDFLEFVANAFPTVPLNEQFMKACNSALEKEMAGYRFVGRKIVRIIDEVEVEAIEAACEVEVPPVRAHLRHALELLSDRTKPDYRNSMKESILAVEALAKVVTGDAKNTLGQLLDSLKESHGLHPALCGVFEKLYGYTSDAGGIRHALMDEDDLTFEDAKFMLVACSAFVNFVGSTLEPS